MNLPLLTGTALAVFAVDQMTKALAGTVHLNDEFALGVASAPSMIAAALMAAGIVAFLYAARRWHAPAIAAGLFVGGSISNLSDRLVYGQVRDFIVADPIVLNLADLALVAGLAVWLISALVRQPAKGGVHHAQEHRREGAARRRFRSRASRARGRAPVPPVS